MNEDLFVGLEAALQHGGATHSMRDVLRQIDAGHAQLWARDGRAAIVTEIHHTPRAKVVHFWLAAGELEPVVELSRAVLEWARGEGCTRATLAGRRGWERALKAEGWEYELSVLGRGL